MVQLLLPPAGNVDGLWLWTVFGGAVSHRLGTTTHAGLTASSTEAVFGVAIGRSAFMALLARRAGKCRVSFTLTPGTQGARASAIALLWTLVAIGVCTSTP